jgi:CMP-N,N'-diacetyllegionaminic acid synthase
VKTLAFIPARSGSKGVINKNIRLLDGIPLLAYSVHIAQMCLEENLFTDILVSTDSNAYLDTIKNTGYDKKYIRPSEIASDSSPTIDAVIHALEYYKKQDISFEAVMILQPTSPFRNIELIRDSIELMNSNSNTSCVASVFKLNDHHPRRIKLINDNGFLKDFCDEYREPEPSRRQDFQPDAFIRSGSIYLTKTTQIVNERLIRGNFVKPIEVSEFYSINVDEEVDFFKAEALINSNKFREELKVFKQLKKKYEA